MRIGIVAGEASGDILGAGLIQAIKRQYPSAEFAGIGGPLMIEQGCKSLVAMERLSIMGLVEVLGRLIELFAIKKKLQETFLRNPPDVFIGIDAPDFNLRLEKVLHDHGIKTVHYVSPSVWAWRAKRVLKIAKSVDLMLTLFPFETEIYHRHNVRADFVGHPLADLIDPDSAETENDKKQARRKLGLHEHARTLALLPGSRGGEVSRLGNIFMHTAKRCAEEYDDLQIVIPCVNKSRRKQIEQIIAGDAKNLSVTLIDGQSDQVMAAADVVVLASGTATLEALLLKRPMVVCYRLAPLTYWIVSRLLQVDYFSLPNLLAGRQLVPEYVQNSVTVENLSKEVLSYFSDSEKVADLQEAYIDIHNRLKCGASERAAQSVLRLIHAETTMGTESHAT